MDSESARLILEAFATYQRGDERRLREDLLDPEIEVHADPGILNAGTFHGWDGFRQWVAQWEEAWEEITYQPLGFIDVDDARAVVPVHTTGKGRGSGIEIESDFFYFIEVRNDRCARLHIYPTEEQALEVARQPGGKR